MSPTPTLTATSTATIPPSPTPSETPSPTVSPTATGTSTPSVTLSATPTTSPTPSSCGNATLDPSEECDDGNLVAGDGCDDSCRSELVPGTGSRRSDCVHEWLTDPLPKRASSGIPLAQLSCHDDDPGCDFGASTGDAACTFHVASCLNVDERRFRDRTGAPRCQPTDVVWVVWMGPREADPRDDSDRLNRDALEAAFVTAGATVRQQCQPVGVEPSTPCTSSADCPGMRACRTRFLFFNPPLTTTNHCTSFADVIVPLHRNAKGSLSAVSRTLRLVATSSTRTRDGDALRLNCLP